MKQPKDKVTLLSDHKLRAKQRNSILLDKKERREILGFKARQREINQILEPFNKEINEFLVELQEKYLITINVTHQLDWDNSELVPLPEEPSKEEPK